MHSHEDQMQPKVVNRLIFKTLKKLASPKKDKCIMCFQMWDPEKEDTSVCDIILLGMFNPILNMQKYLPNQGRVY